jgi:hypothetical protein
VAGDLEAAVADLDAALALCDGQPDVGLLAQAAAVAFKSGDADRGEEQAKRAAAVSPAAAAYALAAEAARAKLPRALKQRFDAAMTVALAAPPTGPAAAAIAAVHIDQFRHGAYLGQKAHEKRIQAYMETAITANPGEADLARLCERFRDLGWWRLLRKAATRGRKRFPRNPFFPFFEAVVYLATEGESFLLPAWKIEPLIEKARRLAENWPPDDAVRQLFRDLDDAQRRLTASVPGLHMLNELFDMFDDD